ncbi:DUF3017 domain-containing protein [Janibacter alittae]|uniref:DUF3017 domain-containing protein n=1 Tax=Janibacter alittae TaxID=3115209 RepID=A0ABZ2MF55_9MICO
MPDEDVHGELDPDEVASEDLSEQSRPALDVPPLAAWWVIAAGVVVGLIFVLTDHVLRATAVLGATLVLAAVLRIVLSTDRAGGLVVRSRVLDVLTLVVLAGLIVVSGFTLDMTPR